MPLVPSMVRDVLVPWSVAVVLVSSSTLWAAAGEAAQEARKPAWPCRLVPVSKLRPVVEKGMERSETHRRQCEELATARAVVVLEWGVMDSSSLARTEITNRDGVVVATVKLPPVGDTIALMAHELQHVIEQTRGLDLRAEANRAGSGVWQALGSYETQDAVDVERQVAKELRAYSRVGRN